MGELEYTDFTQALREARIITRKQHINLNYHLRARLNQIDYIKAHKSSDMKMPHDQDMEKP